MSATERPSTRHQKRCWNCRDHKIAYDRSQPSCSKCKRRQDDCKGYGVKLSWPKENDSRRSVSAKEHFLVPSQSRNLDFINTFAGDIELLKKPNISPRLWERPTSYDLQWLSQLPSATITPRSHSYATAHLPVSLLISSSTAPSLATRHALSALSYQQLDKQKASLHQSQAIRSLQLAIATFPASRAWQTMAASMILSIYEVRPPALRSRIANQLMKTINSDSSELSWSVFFCGTKTIAGGVTRTNDTIRHWKDKNSDQIQLAGQKKIISKAIFAPERQLIVSTSGCSLEMLDLVCQAVDAVLDLDDPRHLSELHLKTIRSLEIRTRGIEQRL
ncbi:hypothetical protein GE09DRAFT_1126523, partial [Coniochaeta sp. 2T2.1]